MKIVFFSHLGEEKQPVAKAWAGYLRDFGHEVTFVSPRGGYGRLPSFEDWRRVGRNLKGVDAIFCCDIWSLGYVFLRSAPKAIKVYSCFELYSEIIPWNRRVKLERKWIEWLERRLIRSEWKWIFGNAERRSFYNKKYAAEGGEVIMNYPTPLDKNRFRCRRELRSILLVGTINQRIPVADVKFLAWYCSLHGIKLVIAGSIQPQFRELKGYSSVVLLPYKTGEDYLDLLAESSLGFVAYVQEGKNYELCAPVKVYDYLFSGMPVLASNQVTLNSIASEKTGMLTYVLGDFESLHNQLEEFRLNWSLYSNQALEGGEVFLDRERLFGRTLRAILELN